MIPKTWRAVIVQNLLELHEEVDRLGRLVKMQDEKYDYLIHRIYGVENRCAELEKRCTELKKRCAECGKCDGACQE